MESLGTLIMAWGKLGREERIGVGGGGGMMVSVAFVVARGDFFGGERRGMRHESGVVS